MEKRVLIVDDEESIVVGLSTFFEIKEIPAAGAFDCDGAVRMLGDTFYPVVIADLCLRTEENGMRLLEEIRGRSPRSRVVVISGYITPEREEQLLGDGVALVLRKPAPTEAILQAVEALLAEIENVANELEIRDEQLDLEQLYLTVRQRLLGVPRHRFHLSPDSAEDVLQDAWLLFLQKRGLIRSAGPWLAGTVANLCRQHIDRSVRRGEVAEEEAMSYAVGSNPSDILAVREAIAKLDERAQQLFTLIAFEGRSYEEVSAATGLRLGSIGPLYIRAKERLRKALEH
ncbi:MAG TPA: sigma-70 family RNA polymerase sigma factor [Thermoanaerobaculia bacterium]|jgi:RNA polymerase sigma factor (sigma-70 family)